MARRARHAPDRCTPRSRCPVAGTLDLLGDAWTLLVIRDLLFYDKHRFADFLDSPEGISTNILAERLKRLEARGLVERRRYQERPPRDAYFLTARGHDLLPVLRELIKWGQAHVRGTAKPPARQLRRRGAAPGTLKIRHPATGSCGLQYAACPALNGASRGGNS